MNDDRTALEKELLGIEKLTSTLEPESLQFKEWVSQAHQYAEDFMEHTDNGPAWIPYLPGSLSWDQDLLLSEGPSSLDEFLASPIMRPAHPGLNPASGGHLGYIPGGGVLPAAIGDFLAAVTNRYAGIAFADPGAVAMEHSLVRWMTELFGFPPEAGGTLTSGGSIANLVAITAARDASGLKPSQWERATIYGSSQMHHCIHKALRIAGLGHSILREVPLDEEFRIRPDRLREMIDQDKQAGLIPLMIIGSAGTTDTGVVDPLDIMADIAEEGSIWFHVDGAYGGFFYLLDSMRSALRGIERADSLVIDPHKGLFLPYGTGAVLLRDVQLLASSQHYQANYMQDARKSGLGLSPADLSPELTRHFRGLRMFLPLKIFGIQAFRACLWEKVLLCRLFHREVAALGFETGPEPMLSVTRFRWVPRSGEPNHWNQRLISEIHSDGRIFLSSTTLNGEVWIRFAALSFRTKMTHVRTALQMLTEIKERIHASPPIAE